MVSGFLDRLKLQGALVSYIPPDVAPSIVVFQYNPDEMRRSLQARTAEDGGRGDTLQTDGPPEESISLTVEIDATDQLEHPQENPIAVNLGLHPALASLENLMYPAYPTVMTNLSLALGGSGTILSEPAPLTLLIWGRSRILPVKVTGLSITEQAFDDKLNPIRATIDLTLNVLTYRDLEVNNPGYWVYLTAFSQKETLAALNATGQGFKKIRGLLPF